MYGMTPNLSSAVNYASGISNDKFGKHRASIYTQHDKFGKANYAEGIFQMQSSDYCHAPGAIAMVAFD